MIDRKKVWQAVREHKIDWTTACSIIAHSRHKIHGGRRRCDHNWLFKHGLLNKYQANNIGETGGTLIIDWTAQLQEEWLKETLAAATIWLPGTRDSTGRIIGARHEKLNLSLELFEYDQKPMLISEPAGI